MCWKCTALVEQYFPTIPKEDRYNFLMSATCFPFCSPDGLEIQLKSMKEKGIQTMEQAIDHITDY